MSWRRALRQTLGFVAGVAVGAIIFVAGMVWQGASDRALLLEQGQRLEDAAARHCVYLQPQAPRQYP